MKYREKRKLLTEEAAKNGFCKGCLKNPVCDRSKSYCEHCLDLRYKANQKYNETHRKENSARTSDWQRRNPDKVKVHAKRNYERHKDKIYLLNKAYKQTDKYKSKASEYRVANKDKLNKVSLEWQRRNPERRKMNVQNWLTQNPGKTAEYSHRYRKSHPEQDRKSSRERRERIKSVNGCFSAKEWMDLCDKFNNTCLWCGKVSIKLTVDHVVPVSKGGTGFISNIQPLCPSCNSRKNDKILDFRPFGAAILEWT